MSSVTSVRTVGRSTPSPVRSPPEAIVAPAAVASSIQLFTRSVSPGSIRADTSVSSSDGSPTTSDSTSFTRASVKSAAIDSWT